MSPLQKSLLSACTGALAYGAWAYWVNMPDGNAMALRTGAVQGSFSFVITLTMTLMLEGLFRAFGRSMMAAAGTLAIVSAFLFCTAYALQWAAGSQAILMTIIPGYLIGTAYGGVYLWSLLRQQTGAST
jgi:hypothetical protein